VAARNRAAAPVSAACAWRRRRGRDWNGDDTRSDGPCHFVRGLRGRRWTTLPVIDAAAAAADPRRRRLSTEDRFSRCSGRANHRDPV